MNAIPISNNHHSMYTYAIIQVSVETKKEFKAILKYMKQAYGPGIEHTRAPFCVQGYKRNSGDNKVWYYASEITCNYRFDSSNYKIYLTTPEQVTMVGMLFD